MNYTVLTNDRNVNTVRQEIKKKIDPERKYIYLPSKDLVKNIVTDMDHWPYTRYYRGVAGYNEPIVMEREAGWRPMQQPCYTVYYPVEKAVDPQVCFQSACSTAAPCHVKDVPTIQLPMSFREDELRNLKYTTEALRQYRLNQDSRNTTSGSERVASGSILSSK